MFAELVKRNRSYRRFNPNRKVLRSELEQFIELARLTPSARNAQPLKYALITDNEKCNQIYPLLHWAGYLKDWDGPDETEKPTAFIIVLRDNEISKDQVCDDGIAMQTILLAAVEKGLGGCIIGAFEKAELILQLQIPNQYHPLYVIALGKPTEEVVIENISDNNIKYWHDEANIHHVPKRSLNEILLP